MAKAIWVHIAGKTARTVGVCDDFPGLSDIGQMVNIESKVTLDIETLEKIRDLGLVAMSETSGPKGWYEVCLPAGPRFPNEESRCELKQAFAIESLNASNGDVIYVAACEFTRPG